MPNQGQKFVIVGGTGLVGSAVAHSLINSHSADVIICDTIGDVHNRKWANLPTPMDDLWTPDTLLANLDKAWRDIAGVILLADDGQQGDDGDALFETSYHVPRRVWDYCVSKQRPLFWASSSHVYGNGASNVSRVASDVAALRPVTAFGTAKHAFDLFAARQGTGPDTPSIWAGMRLSSVYGKSEQHKGFRASLPVRAMAHAKAGTNLSLWDNCDDVTRDWVHVNDAGNAIAALVAGGHAGFYDIGTGVATSTRDLLNKVEAMTGRTLTTTLCEDRSPRPTSLAVADTSSLEAVGISIQFASLEQGLAHL